MFHRNIPIVSHLQHYNANTLKRDSIAGLTVGVMLIPQGMAYALIAGVPAIYGLYASLVPLVVYACLGTSRQLSVAPVAMMSILTAAGVAPLAEGEPSRYIMLAMMLALMVGVIQLLMGLARFGFLTNFLSHPILAGFTSAAALIIGFSQLKYLLGIDLARTHLIHEIVLDALTQMDAVQIEALLVGMLGIVMLLGLKRWFPSFPGALGVVGLSIIAVWFLSLEERGLAIIGAVPEGLPAIGLPFTGWDDVKQLIPTALAISMVGFMESIAVAKVYAARNSYDIQPNQELVGLGMANLIGSFFQAFPTAGGFSRTAVNAAAGAKTQVASLVSAGVIGLTLLFLTPLFYYLPKAILAAIVMVAVAGLIDWKEARYLWRVDKRDFGLMMLTFLATLALGIEMGILVGVAASLMVVVHQSSRPHTAIEGRLPGTDTYRNILRNPSAITVPGVAIYRFDASLYFANVNFFKDQLKEIEQRESHLNTLVLNFFPVNRIDSSGAHALREIVFALQQKGTEVYMVGVKGPVRDVMDKAGLSELIGEENFFFEVHEAVKRAAKAHQIRPQKPSLHLQTA